MPKAIEKHGLDDQLLREKGEPIAIALARYAGGGAEKHY